MKIRHLATAILLTAMFLSYIGCDLQSRNVNDSKDNLPANVLSYAANPDSSQYRSSLAFSDQGAWFAYGFPTDKNLYGGFSGPFLMTQENGKWCSKMLSQLELTDLRHERLIDWQNFTVLQSSYNSHLKQVFENGRLRITQQLFFSSAHTALIITDVVNLSDRLVSLQPAWVGDNFLDGLSFSQQSDRITINSTKSPAIGIIQIPVEQSAAIALSGNGYRISPDNFTLKPGDSQQLLLSQTFIFPEYDAAAEDQTIDKMAIDAQQHLQHRIEEKKKQLNYLENRLDSTWNSNSYRDLLAKTVLTLQNNWRIPAGELKHSGLFPSYHYVWFHGFWAWDSWKHAVALAQYDTDLAKDQIKAMFDFQNENGFIADCVYRDTTIENHNYRNSKPPLSAWAVWKVYRQDNDVEFLAELYPKIQKQHRWWYTFRDHDKDGICEYGSTDGTLIAAKWESGMDNAVRFDDSRILRNSDGAWSLDQESVDLNAYLFAEKLYLAKMAKVLKEERDEKTILEEAATLKAIIQNQFYDTESGWFYDTSIDGKTFIKAMGCEGWIPLWAKAATANQATAVKENMINSQYFYSKIPFQTLSASHPKFNPDGGYWRGPVWLDQAYFGVKGLHNYGFHSEAYAASRKLILNAEGVCAKGLSIRENYHPVTGAGLEAENFSWSAAHYLLLLLQQ